MIEEIICGVYKIINLIDGKLYIGSTNNIYKRWNEHKLQLRRHKHHNIYLQRSWDKHGEDNFIFEIIEKIKYTNNEELKNSLTYTEQKWIDYYNVIEDGYNIAPKANSLLGFNFKKPVIQFDLENVFIKEWESITEAIIYLKKDNINANCIGKCCTGKLKTSGNYKWLFKEDYVQGKLPNYNYIEKIRTKYKNIYQYDLDGNFIKGWNSCLEISKTLGINKLNVRACCDGNINKYANSFWSYEKHDNFTIEDKRNEYKKEVLQFDLEGIFVKEWYGMVTIEKELNISKVVISACCRGKQKTAGNFIWILKDEYNERKLEYDKYLMDLSNKILQLDYNYNIIYKFSSKREINIKFNKKISPQVKMCLDGKLKSCYGYIWMLESEYYKLENINEYKHHLAKTVYQLNEFNAIINEFPSCSEAQRRLGVSNSRISAVCLNKRKSAGGFKWMYKEDYDKLVS